MNIAVVTGASSGLGREFVIQISKNYPELKEIWVIARRKNRLEELKESCTCKLRILPFDLSNSEDLLKVEELFKKTKPKIHILMNGAGFGKYGEFSNSNYQDILSMIDVNCKSLTAITYLSIPYMKKGGTIISISSAAAFLPQARFAVYSACKSYVLSFSRALRSELYHKRIYVMAICPGPVATEFFDISHKGKKIATYKNLFMAKPKKVVEVALKDMKIKKEISVYGWPMKCFQVISKILPHKLLIWINEII